MIQHTDKDFTNIFISLHPDKIVTSTHKWKTGSIFLYKETCVTQAVNCFTSERKEMQITNKKLSHYPSLPTPPEQIKAQDIPILEATENSDTETYILP